MNRYCVGQDGVVVNVIAAETKPVVDGCEVFLDPTGSTNVGDSYDPKDVRIDAADQVLFELVFRLHNRVRVLEGLSQHTAQQFKTFVKTIF